MGSAATVEIRRFTTTDEPAVLRLLEASLGWIPDEQYTRFFAWKHVQNPYGRSPAWVATDAGEVTGFRTYLRWEFVIGGRVVRAVRAVDTATHPDHQGRGIFSALTLHSLAELREDGTAFVFNTPNERSRPGYLKMGWQPVLRLPVVARPSSLGALSRLARARTPADKWSAPSGAGVAATDALADRAGLEALLDSLPTDGLRTHRSVAYLTWRYGFTPLEYRAVSSPQGVRGGLIVFRLRRRGAALEAAVCEELVPADDLGTARRLLRRVLRESGADHAVRIGGRPPRAGFMPVPGQGPQLVWRDVAGTTMPEPSAWRLGLGDVELF
ncbi:MAG: GNAT family N-acetyltransferase [Jiangellaceae bacterium]